MRSLAIRYLASNRAEQVVLANFLASDAARWITGASIPVDGGSKL
jgi:NAD(P)-dependent dehydrogenase (short-subunit alcohol dehydrogenase family)